MHSFESSFDATFLRPILVEQGLHPDDVGALLRYAPAALTHLCWRNTILEDWHAGPDSRISDAEMMRANVATSRIFHQSIWYEIGEAWANAGPLSHDMIDVGILEQAFSFALVDAFSAERVLPHGLTLGELGGDEWEEFEGHADRQLGALLEVAEQRGAHVVAMWLGLRGSRVVGHWWGTPKWPFVVDKFLDRIDDPGDRWWQNMGGPSWAATRAGR